MTSYELQHRFDLEVLKYGVVDPVMSTIVEDYLNYAYQQYITEKYDSLINPVEKFEITERISRILAPLIDDYSTTSFTSITTNNVTGKTISFYVAGPGIAVLQYIIKEHAKLNTIDCNGDAVIKDCRVIPMKHNLIDSNINNPFLNPTDDEEEGEIWRVNIMSGRLELIIPYGTTLNTYKCRYLKKQTAINLTTGITMEIDSSVHEEVVLKAVIMYLSDQRNNNKNEK